MTEGIKWQTASHC